MYSDLSWLALRLRMGATLVSAASHGSGHIHETYVAVYADDATSKRFRLLHQRINTDVFRDPVSLMDNLVRVTDHIRDKLRAGGHERIDRRVLTLVRDADGASYVVDDSGGFWRTFGFIEGATTFDVVETPEQAFEVARAFGEFQALLVDLVPPRLADTIAGFHDTPRRWARFERAIERDVCNRAAGAATEIRRAVAQSRLAGALVERQDRGLVPERVAHNDTKINNVLIDDETGRGICVIDLDTVMPGRAIDDFGELVRTSTCFAREDDRDVSKAAVEMPLFEALVRGYLASTTGFLGDGEIAALVLSGQVMTLENAIRFLADHLEGDVYFKVHRPGQNLDRARVQLALLDSMNRREAEMRRVVERVLETGP